MQEQNNHDSLSEEEGSGRFSVSAAGLFLLELVKVVVLAAITIFLVRYFLFKPFYVKGKSMEPNFHEHEYLIIDKLTYRIRTLRSEDRIHRGEVVVLEAPSDEDEHYLKRVVGLPGERIKIEEGKVYICNEENPLCFDLKEPYLVEVTTGVVASLVIPEDSYFLMGDNRDQSFDSRSFGTVTKDKIVGRAWFRGWPLDKVGLLREPSY